MAPNTGSGVVAALLLVAGTGAAAQKTYLQAGGSVSYNGGGYDWLVGTQLLDSVGSKTPPTSAGVTCTNSATVQHAPINVVRSGTSTVAAKLNASLSPLTYNYPPVSDYELEMNEHTLEVKFNLASPIASTYGMVSPANGYLNATQLHFHSPSEHTIDGIHYPLELHIVNQVYTPNAVVPGAPFQTAAGGVPGSVIGIMFQYTPANQDNPWLTPLLNNVPKGLNFSAAVTAAMGDLTKNQYYNKINALIDYTSSATNPLDIGQIVAAADPSAYFTYPGTLTTPGCNAIVTFYLLKNPQPISYRQVVAFTNLLAAAQGGISRGADNRPPNPLLPSTTVQMTTNMFNAMNPPAPAPIQVPVPVPVPGPPLACSGAAATAAAVAGSLVAALLAVLAF